MYSHACLLPYSNTVAVGPLIVSDKYCFSLEPKRVEEESASQGIILFHFDSDLSARVTSYLYVLWEYIGKWAHLRWFVFFLFPSTSCDWLHRG